MPSSLVVFHHYGTASSASRKTTDQLTLEIRKSKMPQQEPKQKEGEAGVLSNATTAPGATTSHKGRTIINLTNGPNRPANLLHLVQRMGPSRLCTVHQEEGKQINISAARLVSMPALSMDSW